MPHDPVRIAETTAWLRRAANDLAAADHDLCAKPALWGDAAFHAQQAVEKVVKGFLTWHGQPFRKTHNLVELGQQCAGIDASLEPLLRGAAPLTEYAWKFRYPGQPEEPSEREARDALETARAVYEAVLVRLPAEVRP
jgi:HEPN domain-containing protein